MQHRSAAGPYSLGLAAETEWLLSQHRSPTHHTATRHAACSRVALHRSGSSTSPPGDYHASLRASSEYETGQAAQHYGMAPLRPVSLRPNPLGEARRGTRRRCVTLIVMRLSPNGHS